MIIVLNIANTDRRTTRWDSSYPYELRQEHLNNNNNNMGNTWCAPHFDTPAYFDKRVTTVTRFVGPKIMQLSNTFCKIILYSSAGTLWHCTSCCGERCNENRLIRKRYRWWPRFPIRLTDHWQKYIPRSLVTRSWVYRILNCNVDRGRGDRHNFIICVVVNNNIIKII